MSKNESTFKIGGEITINRLGFGAMRLTGSGIWGPPANLNEAVRVIQRLPEVGVNFIDTADSYGPNLSEELLRDHLPHGHTALLATKAGLARTGPDQWTPLGRPEYLIQQAYSSLRRLGVDQISLWQLHRIDPRVPRDEQFDAIRHLLGKGVIKHAGLSEVSVEEIRQASNYFPVATVQNRYNLSDRGSEDVLDYATEHGIGFIPWYPLAAGELARPGSILDAIATRHQASTGQIALAWLLHRSPVMLPIPGTSSVAHLEQNMAAANITLSEQEFTHLDNASKREG
jgi:aryl-alcohol dehydrogenase-like predicted oxidoreductase